MENSTQISFSEFLNWLTAIAVFGAAATGLVLHHMKSGSKR